MKTLYYSGDKPEEIMTAYCSKCKKVHSGVLRSWVIKKGLLSTSIECVPLMGRNELYNLDRNITVESD